ncbi:MAG TPA: endopeptidase La, partial [Kofleriaceae bacterium]|nr:endopeptidase La [Kofleriaceae bacterium]
AILEADHTGLEPVKKRILELVAVRKLAPNRKGTILCLVGPPGVGKTSLGRSIATALGRKYVRASLGGVRDDAEIRGHRRTYIGALPGRIINGLKQAGTMNPVFVLDELDKLSSGVRGDPASALLEVLDPEQNREFVDHYLEVPVDLSKVLFLATANIVDTIPPALMDRLEIITLPGYTEVEKLAIAKVHLLPRQTVEHGLEKGQLSVDDAAIEEIIRAYTREAGVRNLERQLAAICRQAAVTLASAHSESVHVGLNNLAEILGPPIFFSEVAGSVAQVGVAMGLAWTPVGGDILFIESRLMPGTGELKTTGQLGDVMSESVRAAMSYLRANSERVGIDGDRIQRSDIHLHVPAGAIRKDGPSAGLALTTAFASLLSDRPVRPDVALTGEITLRGQVLPVGGIKSKLLAAHRADIRTVVLPERNRKDIHDVPQSVIDDLDLRFVHRIDEALEVAFGEPPARAVAGAAVPIPPVATPRPTTPPPPVG